MRGVPTGLRWYVVATDKQLAARLRDAADTLEELSKLTGHPNPAWPVWNALQLRREADVLEAPDV